ncbi:hypothetical protein [uncultured Helicobacter sp.]|uniref:hypothetical protein n=1 Tax=uncultured Helicobacter sp. TaxID=175537 RepID=UPI001C3BC056|nr:hypothetical protein [Candidatus Helicobacter avicola]
MESNSPVLRLRDHTLPFIESKDFLDSINIASGFRFHNFTARASLLYIGFDRQKPLTPPLTRTYTAFYRI